MKILTAKEMIESTEQMMKDACKEEGIEYSEFLVRLNEAMDRLLGEE